MESEKNKERPLDCSSCKRTLKTRYTCVEGKIVNRFYMCAECPVLKDFLSSPSTSPEQDTLSHLACGHCKTTLVDIKRGEPVGCAECYEIFEDYLAKNLKNEHFLQSNIDLQKPLHQGHKPGEFKEYGSSLKIFALNEALNEMIHREDYEQAASIRDQIKELKKEAKRK